MGPLTIHLFGKIVCDRAGESVFGLHSGKFQELFCYLLLHRDRPLTRETIANVFWGDFTTVQSRKYLRQALWQLQGALDAGVDEAHRRVLKVEPGSVGIDPQAEIWLDVDVFERAFVQVQKTVGDHLEEHQACSLREAVRLYRGDLLEGWYQDWCLFERERLQNMYLAMLDKLMCYSEAHDCYQAGLEYGERVLALDRAHERTHQRMVRLHYLSGDRARALRQFDRCVRSLAEELNVKPAARTLQLHEQVRADHLELPQCGPLPAPAKASEEPSGRPTLSPLPEILKRLRGLEEVLADAHLHLQQNIQVVERILHGNPRPSLSQNGRAD